MYALLLLLPCVTAASVVFPANRCPHLRTVVTNLGLGEDLVQVDGEQRCWLGSHNESIAPLTALLSATASSEHMLNLVMRDMTPFDYPKIIANRTLDSLLRVMASAMSGKRIPDLSGDPNGDELPDKFELQASNASMYAILLYRTGRFNVTSAELRDTIIDNKFAVFVDNLVKRKIQLYWPFAPQMDVAGWYFQSCLFPIAQKPEKMVLEGTATVLDYGGRDLVHIMVNSIWLYERGYSEMSYRNTRKFFRGRGFVDFAKRLCPDYDTRY